MVKLRVVSVPLGKTTKEKAYTERRQVSALPDIDWQGENPAPEEPIRQTERPSVFKGVTLMPNYIAHNVCGKEVRRRLPEALQKAVAADPVAYRLGLYGPDPLLFAPGGANCARALHKEWEQNTAPRLQRMMQRGNPSERSFAAGYLCHLVLDDLCHPQIYRWMEEGLSHQGLEVGLDLLLLKNAGQAYYLGPNIAEKSRVTEVAARALGFADVIKYRLGLSSMSICGGQMDKVGKIVSRRMGADYHEPIQKLMDTLEEAAESSVRSITDLVEGELLTLPPAPEKRSRRKSRLAEAC